MNREYEAISSQDPAETPDRAVSQDIEDFIYLISHDVRSSVRALLELPQWIKEDLEEAGVKVDGQVASSIELMNRHTGRLDRMLVDLLTYSRVGRMQSVREVDLNEALDDVIDEITVPSGFQIVRAFDVDVIRIGERDILTLFTALISNAIKHHDGQSGKIVITSSIKEGMLRLAVADDGPGIPEEFRNRVFGAMTTLRPRDEVEGSGMGLANVRKIAGHYDGSARIATSPYGRGLLVEVFLPLSAKI